MTRTKELKIKPQIHWRWQIKCQQLRISPEYNVSNHPAPHMPVQITYQQISSHHQFLTKGSRSKMHVQHLILYIKFTCIEAMTGPKTCPRVDEPPFIQRRPKLSCLQKASESVFPSVLPSFCSLFIFLTNRYLIYHFEIFTFLHEHFIITAHLMQNTIPNVHDWYLL